MSAKGCNARRPGPQDLADTLVNSETSPPPHPTNHQMLLKDECQNWFVTGPSSRKELGRLRTLSACVWSGWKVTQPKQFPFYSLLLNKALPSENCWAGSFSKNQRCQQENEPHTCLKGGKKEAAHSHGFVFVSAGLSAFEVLHELMKPLVYCNTHRQCTGATRALGLSRDLAKHWII